MDRILTTLSSAGLWITRVVIGIGCLVCLAAMVFGSAWLYRSGWLENMAPQPRLAQAVAVRVYGPQVIKLGETVYFHADIDGKGGEPRWDITPPLPGALKVLPGGRTAEFRANDEGDYILTVSVAGEALQVASDTLTFANLELVQPDPEPTESELAQQQLIKTLQAQVAALQLQSQQVSAQAVEPPLTVKQIIEDSLHDVQSEDQVAEGRIIAGCIRSVVNRIDTGLTSPDMDPVLEIHTQVKTALGEKANGWLPFMQAMDTAVGALKQQGEITTAASTTPALNEIASVLLYSR